MKADPTEAKKYFEAANTGSSVSNGSESAIEDVADPAVFSTIIASAGITVVDYWAPWCKNCKKITPLLTRLAGEMPDVKFIKVDTTDAEEIAHTQKIDSLPSLHFFKAGVKVAEFKGSDLAKIESAIRGAAAL